MELATPSLAERESAVTFDVASLIASGREAERSLGTTFTLPRGVPCDLAPHTVPALPMHSALNAQHAVPYALPALSALNHQVKSALFA